MFRIVSIPDGVIDAADLATWLMPPSIVGDGTGVGYIPRYVASDIITDSLLAEEKVTNSLIWILNL